MEHQIESIAQQVLDGLLRQKQVEEQAKKELSVLIVEDDPNDALLAKRPLVKKGLNVDIVPTAEEALNKLIRDPNKKHYVMVFLDLILPDHDGIYVLKNIRDVDPNLPVIIMTGAQIDGELVKRAVELGYYGFVSKPFKNGAPEEIFAKHKIPLPS